MSFLNRFKPPWPIRLKLTTILALLSMLGTGIFSGVSYQTEKAGALADIDDVLCSAAAGAQQAVPPMLINEAEAPQRTEPQFTDAYRKTHDILERYVEAARLEFVWVIVARPDGTAYELISNLSPEQQADRADPLEDILLKPYELSPVMTRAAATGEQMIDVDDDDYGYFRSCIIPMKAATGNTVLYGADMNIAAVEARLNKTLRTSATIGAVVLFGTLIFVWFFSAKLTREVGAAVRQTEDVSHLRFAADDRRRRSTTLEIDKLFGALHDMKSGLLAFSKYVPSAVITRVLETGKAEVGGERRELSLLMTDVTDFTTISEQLEPERVMVVMSEYFDRVVAPILGHHGTLDKYVGDAIFSYWNAPLIQANHAVLCCRAALDARTASKTLAREWAEMGRWPWHTRFGLHTGETVFGNVGAPDRMDFTVIGSSVNLASRIEGMNKHYGTEILVSERLRELADHEFLFRSVDFVLPKGAFDAFEIFELLSDRAQATPEDQAYVFKWQQAYRLYRDREWATALSMFTALAAERPDDKVAALYIRRCHGYLAQPPPADWDGVTRYDSK
ncbi:MAG: adenylate/guanylate cyclase domain-containing protein [Rhodospirillaceae bacterium]|nr:adenylate/guanylate cyclase domain-containing protein [Rhodospirillaceae bacterium]